MLGLYSEYIQIVSASVLAITHLAHPVTTSKQLLKKMFEVLQYTEKSPFGLYKRNKPLTYPETHYGALF